MAILCLLSGAIEILWCVIMPVIGSLYLISEKHKEENKEKTELLKHWCNYWIGYFLLKLVCGFLCFLPIIGGTLCLLRVALLSVMASPKLGVTNKIADFLQNKAGFLTDIKGWVMGMILDKIGGEKKDK